MPTALVTGASTGIGRATALLLDSDGWKVYAGVRREADAESLAGEGSDRLAPLILDVTDPAQMTAAAERIRSECDGRLDGLVNNAGISLPSPLETMPIEDFRRQVEVNLTAQVAVTQAMLPLIRAARGGRIVFISSIGGRIAFPMTGAYHAAKFGIEAVGDVFRRELRRWGISVSIVEPGSIATAIWDRGERTADEIGERSPELDSLYGAAIEKYRGVVKGVAERGIPPEQVARAIEHALAARRPRTRYLVGLDAKFQARAEVPDPDQALRPDRRSRDRRLGPPSPFGRGRSTILSRTRLTGQSARVRSPITGEVALRVAAVQLNSTDEKPRNLATAERLVRAAAADGAELVALPEKWNLLAGGEALLAGAETLDGPSLSAARGWARELGIDLLAGSISERREGEKAFNTSVLIGPDGEDLAVYRKIHMFDVDVGGVSYRESEHEEPGSEIVTADARGPDRRADRLLRPALPGAVPDPRRARRPPGHRPVGLHAGDRPRPLGGAAAGAGDREPGLRRSPRTRSARRRPHFDSYGHSAIVDPWGMVLATAPDEECFVAADLDLSAQERVRESLPSLANRRPEAYSWPQLAEMRA